MGLSLIFASILCIINEFEIKINIIIIDLSLKNPKIQELHPLVSVKCKNDKYQEKKLNLMQIHLHEVKILQIHNAMPEFVKKYHGY
jgi:hypothetical protein